MHKWIIIIAFGCCYVQVNGQNDSGFVIEGKLLGLKNGNILYLDHQNGKGGHDTVSSCISHDETFQFSGQVAIEGEPYFIKIDTNTFKYNKPIQGYIMIFLENRRIRVCGLLDSLGNVNIVGVSSQEDYLNYIRYSDSLINKANFILRKYSDEQDSSLKEALHEQYEESVRNYKFQMGQWIDWHGNSYITPFVITAIYGDSIEGMQANYDKLTPRAKNGKFGLELRHSIDLEVSLEVGQKAPDFVLLDVEGKIRTLAEEVKKAKFTLVDFWASWCYPCRAGFPKLKLIYDKYRSKGFYILGYSIDQIDIEWKKAVEHDQLSWTNVREQRHLADRLYNIKSVPMTYLIDNQGIIVAKGILYDELENIVSQLLQLPNKL